ncbi:hypothetical protein, partial [Cronobacter sakazakii]|uniref:hypothetical protein n=1 Tax=Cronobacter sakazakii TaxID=28141 RepID=UPI00294AE1AE
LMALAWVAASSRPAIAKRSVFFIPCVSKKEKVPCKTQRGIVPVSGRQSTWGGRGRPAAPEKGENTYAEKH